MLARRTLAREKHENSGLEKQIESLKDSFEKSCKIRADKISFQYYTASGELIANIEV